nr:GNAT family N-acetyltransferase [uncultured Allomuricauda sp.]
MKIRNLKGVDNKEILSVFNESFSDYFVPFKLTEEKLASKMIVDKTDPGLSVGVFENKKLVAFILHGFDIVNNQKVVYNGGTGVIPKKRGSGLTKKMYQYSLPVLEKKGVDKVILEVISKNIQAIKSYKQSGFKTTRELACFKGDFTAPKTNKAIDIKELQSYPWKQMELFWDMHPTWQNSKEAVDKLKTANHSLGAYIKNQFVGYVIFNPRNKRIQQIAVSKNLRRKGIASSLMAELAKKYGNTSSIINVDKKAENVMRFFDSIGFENYLEQLEMQLKINKVTNH